MRRRIWYSLVLVHLSVATAHVNQVSWEAPSEGQSFQPGDSIVGTWTSTKKVISPSFRICSLGDTLEQEKSDDDGTDVECGDSAWPTVEQTDEDDRYSISLVVPDVESHGQFYLEMKSDLGDVHKSPMFSLGSAVQDDSEASLTTPASITTSSSAANSPTDSIAADIPPKRSAPSIAAAIAIPIVLASLAGLAALCIILLRRRRQKQAGASAMAEKPSSGSTPEATAMERERSDLEKAVALLSGLGAVPVKPESRFKDVVRRFTIRRAKKTEVEKTVRPKVEDVWTPEKDIYGYPGQYTSSNRQPVVVQPATCQPLPYHQYPLSPIDDLEEIEIDSPRPGASARGNVADSTKEKQNDRIEATLHGRRLKGPRTVDGPGEDNNTTLSILSSYLVPSPFISSSPYPISPYIPEPVPPYAAALGNSRSLIPSSRSGVAGLTGGTWTEKPLPNIQPQSDR